MPLSVNFFSPFQQLPVTTLQGLWQTLKEVGSGIKVATAKRTSKTCSVSDRDGLYSLVHKSFLSYAHSAMKHYEF